jgi:hypothetical protein
VVRSVLGLPLGCRRSRARRGRARVVYLTYRSRVYYINTVLTVGVLDIVGLSLNLPQSQSLTLTQTVSQTISRIMS